MNRIYSLHAPVWQDMGTTTDEVVTSKELVKLAKADYMVTKRAVYMKELNQDGTANDKEVKGYFATCREDTQVPFAVVKSKYEVVQNHEAFSFLDNLVSDVKDIKFETCGVYNGGASVYITLKLPDIDP